MHQVGFQVSRNGFINKKNLKGIYSLYVIIIALWHTQTKPTFLWVQNQGILPQNNKTHLCKSFRWIGTRMSGIFYPHSTVVYQICFGTSKSNLVNYSGDTNFQNRSNRTMLDKMNKTRKAFQFGRLPLKVSYSFTKFSNYFWCIFWPIFGCWSL